MSRQDLRDEYKETEGHPAVKARIRRLQRQLRRRRMLEDVKRATVVITNPTEFAVALEYGPTMAAPVVVAKGRNLMAQQIKQVARWHGHSAGRKPAAGACPLSRGGSRAIHSAQTLRRGCRHSGGDLPRRTAGAGQPDGSRSRGTMRPQTWLRIRQRVGRPQTASSNGSFPVAAVGMVFVMLVPLPSFAARPAAGHQHHRFGAGAALRAAHSAAGAVLRFSQPAAAAHSVPAVAESGLQPPHSAARQRRRGARPGR